MFSLFKNLKTKTPDELLSIEQLIARIKNNPEKEIIRVIHGMDYRSDEYKVLKELRPIVRIHGEFSQYTNTGLIKYNGYLYFDLDNQSTDKKELIEKYPFINFVTKSIGGRGLFFLIKINNLSDDIFKKEYTNIWYYYREVIFKEIDIDNQAKSINRAVFIPQDTDCIYTGNTVSIDYQAFIDFSARPALKVANQNMQGFKGVEDIDIHPDWPANSGCSVNIKLNTETFIDFSARPALKVANQNMQGFKGVEDIDIHPEWPANSGCSINIKLNTETYINFTGGIDDFYEIIEDGYDFYRMPTYREYKDGAKQNTFARMANELMYLNPNATEKDIYRRIWYENETKAVSKATEKDLARWIHTLYTNTKNFTFKTDKRYINWNPAKKLNEKQKQSIAAKIGAIMKTNETIDKINTTKKEMEEKGLKITNESLAKYSGLSISTIKGNKYKEKDNLLKFNDIIKNEKQSHQSHEDNAVN